MSEYTQNKINNWFDKNKKSDLTQYSAEFIKKRIEDEEDVNIFVDGDRNLLNKKLRENKVPGRIKLWEEESTPVVAEPKEPAKAAEPKESKPAPAPATESVKAEKAPPLEIKDAELSAYDRNLIEGFVAGADIEGGLGDEQYLKEIRVREEYVLARGKRLQENDEKRKGLEEKLKDLAGKHDEYNKQLRDLQNEFDTALQTKDRKELGKLQKKAKQIQLNQTKIKKSHSALQEAEYKPLLKESEKAFVEYHKDVELYNKFQEYWRSKRDIKQELIDESKGYTAKQIPYFWDEKQTIKQNVPQPTIGTHFMLPASVVEDLPKEDFDRTFEAAKEIYELFPPKTISVYTQGKDPLSVTDIDDAITEKAEAAADKILTSPTKVLLTDQKKQRSLLVQRERERIAKLLFGMEIGEVNSEALKSLSVNNISEIFDDVFKDEDKIKKLSRFIYNIKNSDIRGDYRLLEMVLDARGKYTLPGNLKGKQITMNMYEKRKLAEQFYELKSGWEATLGITGAKEAYRRFEELPQHMAENLLKSLPSNKC